MKRAIYLAALCLPITAWAADNKGTYQTLYYISCADYAKDRQEPMNTGKNAVDKIYVSGWLTGYNYLTPNTFDIIPNHNVDMVMQWLDEYCVKHPAKSIESGLLQLTDELYPDRVKNRPEEQKAAKSDAKDKTEPDDVHFQMGDK